jgi:hypothetical protein
VGYYNTFVVRIWCNDEQELMRGYIQHVSTESHAYFLNLENMTDFITGHLGPLIGDSVIVDEAPDARILLAEEFSEVIQDE